MPHWQAKSLSIKDNECQSYDAVDMMYFVHCTVEVLMAGRFPGANFDMLMERCKSAPNSSTMRQFGS